MKRLILAAALVLLSLHAAMAQDIPAVSLTDAAGKTLALRSLQDGKTPFVLTLWMTTCKPCMKELEALTDEVLDWNGNFPLRIYAVSMDDSRSLQRAIAMASGSGWEGITPLFDVNGDLRRALNVSSVPQVFVYDAKGKLAYTHIGYVPGDEAELIKQVRKCASK